MAHFDFSRTKIALIGDLMLDRYIDGSVGRISPEAPVAVLLHQSEHAVAGGAANVAANAAALGGQVRIFGVVGDDEPGRSLVEMLRTFSGVDTDGILVDSGRPTTCKTRVMSARHQIVRIDSESKAWLSPACETALIRALESALNWADVVVVSDYAKGVCSDGVIRAAIDLSARHGKQIIIDPKRRNFEIYRNASLIKPNRRELSDATGLSCETDEEAERAAMLAVEQTGAAVLLTRSERGMSFFAKGAQPLHLATAAREVFDVSGAGDTVGALLALCLADGLPISETMRLANISAGIVVAKVGTAIVTADDLEAALDSEAHHGHDRKGALADLKEAVRRRREWGRRGLHVGFTNGCFDLIHPGHISLLRQAAAACDRLIIGLNTDQSVRRLKGPTRPVQSEEARAIVLGAIEVVDLVVLFDEDTPAQLIAELQPDLLVKGADYRVEDVAGADIVKANGGRVLLASLVPDQSTTTMINRAALKDKSPALVR